MQKAVRGIYRRKGDTAWSFDVVIRGHRFCGSTGCTEKRAAEKWITEYRVEKKAAIAQLDGREPMTFGAASTRWWTERGQHRKDTRTLEGYLALLQSRIGMKTMLATIDDNTVSQLVTLRRADGVSPSTVNRSMTEPLRAILTRAKVIWKQPVPDIAWANHKLKEPAGIVREASVSEEATAFAALRPDLRPIVRFLLATGWRRAEACGLQWSDINLDTGFATVIGKGGIVHRRPLPAAALAVIRGEQNNHPTYVFTYLVRHPNGGRKNTRKPIGPGMLSAAWVRMRDRAGLTLRLHDLRHTTATRVLRATGNLLAASKALGHARVTTTQRYAHMLAEDVRAALDAAAPIASPVAASPAENPAVEAVRTVKLR